MVSKSEDYIIIFQRGFGGVVKTGLRDSGVGYEPVSIVGGWYVSISLDWELRMVFRDSEGWKFPFSPMKGTSTLLLRFTLRVEDFIVVIHVWKIN